MLFSFDESGRFASPRSPSAHQASVVMGVVISDEIEHSLEQEFQAFVAGLKEDELHNSEPKGRLLSLRSRSNFCDLLNEYSTKGLMLTPSILDMGYASRHPTAFTPANMQSFFEEFSKQCPTVEIAESWQEFGQKYGSLSAAQSWRILVWANAFFNAIDHAIIFLCHPPHCNHWEAPLFEIDKVEMGKHKLEEEIFTFMVLSWLSGWSRDRRFTLINEIHTPDNPFCKLYGSEQGWDLKKLIYGHVRFVDSATSWRVQIADIASNIVFRAAHDLDGMRGELYMYASLMRASPYGIKSGQGLIALTGDDESSQELARKYKTMHDSLRRRLPIRW